MALTIGVNAVVSKNGRILLIKRADTKIWALPGGVVEKGETFEEAVSREVKEETDVDIVLSHQTGIYLRTIPFFEDLLFVYKCTCRGSEAKEGLESLEVGWFDKSEALNVVPQFVKTIILDSYIEDKRPQIKLLNKYEKRLMLKYIANKAVRQLQSLLAPS